MTDQRNRGIMNMKFPFSLGEEKRSNNRLQKCCMLGKLKNKGIKYE